MAERYSVAIKELPSEERPRERLMQYGPSALSTAELLAIVLRTGTREKSAIALAQEMIATHEDLRGVANASVEVLARIKGVGKVKGVQIAACVELGRRLAQLSDRTREVIASPEDAARLLVPHLRDAARETFKCLMVDTRHQHIRTVTISVGSLDSSVVHPREVFREAITAGAAGIVVAHNHPSGDPTPSPEDRQVTLRLVEAGRILGIELLDHLVIGDGRWISLKERGML